MIKEKRLAVLKEKTNALDPDKNKIRKFIGCEQADNVS